jgi:hypothetical protein
MRGPVRAHRDGIDLDVILQAAGGVPAQLHRVLAEAIDERSHNEIDSAATERHSARANVTACRAQLARGVRNLRRGRALSAAVPQAVTTTRSRNPYRGLETMSSPSPQLEALRDAHESVWVKANEIAQLAAGENRSFTEPEQLSWEHLSSRLDELDRTISTLAESEQRMADA